MDLKVNALIGATYLIPIAITLRKVYAPCFDIPDTFAVAIAKLDRRLSPRPEIRYGAIAADAARAPAHV